MLRNRGNPGEAEALSQHLQVASAKPSQDYVFDHKITISQAEGPVINYLLETPSIIKRSRGESVPSIGDDDSPRTSLNDSGSMTAEHYGSTPTDS